ncbi:MAG: DUF2939 domain-containing protein [Deltaproteobacteria bacterium]|nr:DUF2939 domain-containing protein [Deltaproteobacteria bacterium]
MKRSAIIIFSTVILLAALVTGGLYWRWVNSPRYALQQMVLAIQAKDMDKLFKYVDLQEIVTNMVQASGKDLFPPEDKDMDEWDRLGRRLGQKVAKFLLPRLLEKFDQQIKKAVEQYLLDLSQGEVLALAAAVTTAEIDTRGDLAEVKLLDPKTGEQFRFLMRRNPATKEWRIVSIRYEDLKRLLKRELL